MVNIKKMMHRLKKDNNIPITIAFNVLIILSFLLIVVSTIKQSH